MQEEFKIIEGFENYEISNLGNVKNSKTDRILKPNKNKRGYHNVDINGKKKLIHQLVALAFLQNPNNWKHVDHINNDTLDNNINNLRWCSIQQNNRNQRINCMNTSGYKGVSYDKRRKKWSAAISLNDKSIFIGRFNTKEEAALARYNKSKELFGEFLNPCENKIIIELNIKNPKNKEIILKLNIDDDEYNKEYRELEKELDEQINN